MTRRPRDELLRGSRAPAGAPRRGRRCGADERHADVAQVAGAPLALDRPRDVDTRRDAELVEDVADVRLDRLVAEEERRRRSPGSSGGRSTSPAISSSRLVSASIPLSPDAAGPRGSARAPSRRSSRRISSRTRTDPHASSSCSASRRTAIASARSPAAASARPWRPREKAAWSRAPTAPAASAERPATRAASCGSPAGEQHRRPRASGERCRQLERRAARRRPPPGARSGRRPRSRPPRARRASGSPSRSSARPASSGPRRQARARAAAAGPRSTSPASNRATPSPQPGPPPPFGIVASGQPRIDARALLVHLDRAVEVARVVPRPAQLEERAVELVRPGGDPRRLERRLAELDRLGEAPLHLEGEVLGEQQRHEQSALAECPRDRDASLDVGQRVVVALEVRLRPGEVKERLRTRRQLGVGEPVDDGSGLLTVLRGPCRSRPATVSARQRAAAADASRARSADVRAPSRAPAGPSRPPARSPTRRAPSTTSSISSTAASAVIRSGSSSQARVRRRCASSWRPSQCSTAAQCAVSSTRRAVASDGRSSIASSRAARERSSSPRARSDDARAT